MSRQWYPCVQCEDWFPEDALDDEQLCRHCSPELRAAKARVEDFVKRNPGLMRLIARMGEKHTA